MTKIYHLSSCSTCKRILTDIKPGPEVILQDIKTEPITESQIEEMRAKAGSYEALFSRRAMKYRAMGLHEKKLSEQEYKHFILEEYTFLKRPVIIVDDQIFIGNAAKQVEAAKAAILG